MSKLELLKSQIEQLPKAQRAKLVRWLSEKDWLDWDAEIERDSAAGRLDFLIREARKEKAADRLKDL